MMWLELREPGKVPQRKGPFPDHETAKVLRDFIAARPAAFITVVTISDSGEPHFQDGPECLEMCDRRSSSVAARHRASSAAAFAAQAST